MESVRVSKVSLQQVCMQYGLKQFGLACDIEGAEVGFILSDNEALKKCQQIIIELHKTDYQGREYSIDELCEIIHHKHGFSLRARRAGVCVFER